MFASFDTSAKTLAALRRLAACSVACLVALAVAIVQIPSESFPYNLRESIEAHPVAMVSVYLTGPILYGAALTAFAIAWRESPHRFAVTAPVLALIAGSLLYFLLSCIAPRESIEDLVGTPILDWGDTIEFWYRFVGLFCGTAAGVVVGLRFTLGRIDHRAWSGLVVLGLIGAAAYSIVVTDAATDNLIELFRDEGGFAFVVSVASAQILMGLSIGAVARGWPRYLDREYRTGLLVGGTAIISGILQWWLLQAATNPQIDKYEQIFSAVEFLLSPDRGAYLDESQLFWRFAAGYFPFLLLSGMGAAGSMLIFQISQLRRAEQRKSQLLAELQTEYLGGAAPSQPADRAVSSHPAAETPARLAPLFGGLALAAAVLLVYGSLVPFEYVPVEWDSAVARFRGMFDANVRTPSGRIDWSVNFLITVPIGFCGMGLLLADRTSRQRTVGAGLLVALFTLSLSCAVEFAQIWFSGRISSRNDVVAQAWGMFCGIGLWICFGRQLSDWGRSFARLQSREERWHWYLQAYLLGFAIYSLLPLDVIMSPRELIQKFDDGKFELVPFSHHFKSDWDAIYAYLTDVVLCIPIGLWAVVAWRPSGQARRFFDSLLLGGLAVLGIETMQAFIVTRYTSSTDLILGIAGVAAGALLMRRRSVDVRSTGIRGNRSGPWLLAAVGYALLLPVVFWAPFDFLDDPELIRIRLRDFASTPFAQMQSGSDLQAIFAVLRKLIWFLPLGVLGGIAISRLGISRGARQAACALGTLAIAGVAFGVEFGQILLPDKFADLTDAVLCTAAGVLALWITTVAAKSGFQASNPAVRR